MPRLHLRAGARGAWAWTRTGAPYRFPCLGLGLMEVTPEPTDEEAAAIVAALEVGIQRAVVAAEGATPPRWRFAGRWWSKPVPARRERPW